jgi:hypothetical protein
LFYAGQLVPRDIGAGFNYGGHVGFHITPKVTSLIVSFADGNFSVCRCQYILRDAVIFRIEVCVDCTHTILSSSLIKNQDFPNFIKPRKD